MRNFDTLSKPTLWLTPLFLEDEPYACFSSLEEEAAALCGHGILGAPYKGASYACTMFGVLYGDDDYSQNADTYYAHVIDKEMIAMFKEKDLIILKNIIHRINEEGMSLAYVTEIELNALKHIEKEISRLQDLESNIP